MRKLSKFYVYMLNCRDNSFYTGYTNDLEKRVKTHNAGKGAKYTRARLPVELVWWKEYKYLHQVMSVEYKIKQLTRLQKESLVSGRRLDRVLKDAQ